MHGDVFGGTYLLARYNDTSWQARIRVQEYMLQTDPSARAALRKDIDTLDVKLADLARQLDEADTDRQDVQTLAGLTSAWKAYASWRDASVLAPLAQSGARCHRYSTRTDFTVEQLRRLAGDWSDRHGQQ